MIDRAQLERPAPLPSLSLFHCNHTPADLFAHKHTDITHFHTHSVLCKRFSHAVCVCVCVLSQNTSVRLPIQYVLSLWLSPLLCFILESPGRQTGQQAAQSNVIQQLDSASTLVHTGGRRGGEETRQRESRKRRNAREMSREGTE